ncbi:TIGR03767 family metallophosphoesterase [Microbacterium sp. VKM Ac-2923]|uniref:TIGR03767 family metallophosphoesterase n=1 Tax=Microbacterium sp. VKM Ac-2923 TaxID=2929476 RepID=UPI001FB3D1E1|nr:TIGR03767 family metallophosphoesterase [Microbacterium sp. VKM Ac-2923]MCJ1706176.1 TIGR03767 family metallophosphoesterase [Microbacterium sp. VKM Ac-2923]
MTGLSRRHFLASIAAAAAATGLSVDSLAPTLARAATAPEMPADVPTTLLQTIRQGAVVSGRYRSLVLGPGEPYLPRLDVLRRSPGAGRAATRRSLLYLGHLSDLHVIEAQSPGRIEPMIVQDHSAWGSAFHPQDPLSPHATAAMVQAFSDARYSPLTGAPMSAAIVTGDSADMHSHLELRWYIDLMDGRSVDPATGGPRWQGVQAWEEAVWAYRPGDPRGGAFGDYGFPRLPDLLAQAIAAPVTSVGLPAPWYAVYGNHDTLLLGTFDISPQLRALAVGARKSFTLDATAGTAFEGWAASTGVLGQALAALGLASGKPGFRGVTANPDRFLFEQLDFMAEHFRTETTPGPVGHGFTTHNLTSGETWWQTDLAPRVRAFGLDTCNAVAGPDGAVPASQMTWLRTQLEIAQRDQVLALIFSHHNSLTLENRATRPGVDEKLYGAEEFVAMLMEFPVVVGWLNGHTHLNQILAHTSATAGFWEITTASCIDFPQQQQVVEIVDNRDGTLSLFTTVLDHASPAVPGDSGSVADLAARSRELAANDWAETPLMRRGSPLDRNTELLLPAPFDLSVITDAQLEAQHVAERARLVAYETARGL